MEPNKVSGRHLAVNGPHADPASTRPTPATRLVRVALLTSAGSWRGSGVSFAAIYNGLRSHGHEPHLVTAAAHVTAAFAAEGLSVSELPLSRTRPSEVLLLRRLLRELRSDVLIVDMPRDLRIGALAVSGTSTRLVNRYNRTYSAPPPRDVLTRLAYRWRVRETVFLTPGGARTVLGQASFMRRVPTRAIPNGIDEQRFASDPVAAAAYRRAHGLGDAPLLLAVGALTYQKRYDVLLAAVRQLPAPHPTLHVCGEGPLAGELRARASALRLDVRFVGQLSLADLRAAYSAATVFVHGCIGETFGRSIGEAMSCRCAVVVPDSGGASEVVGPSGAAGVVVPPLDPEALAAAVTALLADPARRARLGRAARERTMREFSISAMAAAYSRLVEEVVAAG